MTDVGEKLRERIVNHPHYPPNDLDDTFDIVCAELERAAEMVDLEMKYWQACAYSSDDPTIRIAQLSKMRLLEEVAAAIRKLKE